MLLYIQHKYISNLILLPADVVFLNFHYAFGSVAASVFLFVFSLVLFYCFIRYSYIKRQYRVNCCSGKVFKKQRQLYLLTFFFMFALLIFEALKCIRVSNSESHT